MKISHYFKKSLELYKLDIQIYYLEEIFLNNQSPIFKYY